MRIYLAIPYSWNPAKSFEIANKEAARLMEAGHIVFSPVSHSHPIADHLPKEIKIDSDWWMDQDLPFVDWADEIHVVIIGEMGDKLIAKSKGVQMEMQHARRTGKKIVLIDYYE